MGDHRASIKIEMEFHGIKNKCDMWINYDGYNGEFDGVDDRIIEFCRDVYGRGMEKYNTQREKDYQREHKKEIEDGEKAELKRLKTKYESKILTPKK